MSNNLNLAVEFDPKKMRRYLNGENSVFHCHHYATLFTQMADDASELFNGAKHLADAMEESMYPVLTGYFKKNGTETLEDKKRVAEQYCATLGLGQLKMEIGKDGGSAEMAYTHVDEGWLQKWAKCEKPVNYMGQGYIAMAFSAVLDKEPGAFTVEETQSIASGAETSKFKVTKK